MKFMLATTWKWNNCSQSFLPQSVPEKKGPIRKLNRTFFVSARKKNQHSLANREDSGRHLTIRESSVVPYPNKLPR
jgi:hypothetical protein